LSATEITFALIVVEQGEKFYFSAATHCPLLNIPKRFRVLGPADIEKTPDYLSLAVSVRQHSVAQREQRSRRAFTALPRVKKTLNIQREGGRLSLPSTLNTQIPALLNG